MKNLFIVLILFMVFVIVGAPTFEYVYASIHQDCSCCNNQCRMENECQEAAKVCLCRFAAQFQVYLLTKGFLTKLVFFEFFKQQAPFSYAYLFKEDIFHPPKVNFS